MSSDYISKSKSQRVNSYLAADMDLDIWVIFSETNVNWQNDKCVLGVPVCLFTQCHWLSGLPGCAFTSFGIHNIHSLYEQGGVRLCVLHKHQQKLKGCLHHQTELQREKKTQFIKKQ